MTANQRGTITFHLSEAEIRACSLQRLKILHDGCRRSREMARILQGSVIITVPACFANNRSRETFEHPEIAAFARALLLELPGFSFLINFDQDLKYKNLLLSTLSELTLIRRGSRTTFRFPSEEWEQIVEDEVKEALGLANRALFSPRQQDVLVKQIRTALKQGCF